MPVEFISLAFPNASTELNPTPGVPAVDADYLKRYARNLDEYGFDYTLQPYDSGGADFSLESGCCRHAFSRSSGKVR